MISLLSKQNNYLFHDLYISIIVFICIGLVLLVACRYVFKRIHDKKQSVLSRKATCIKKLEKLSAFSNDVVSINYLTFAFDDGSVLEFSLHPEIAKDILVNQKGILTYQGSIFIEFK